MLFRNLCCQVLLAALLTTSASAASHASVFLYHRFGDPRYPSTNIPMENFQAHLQILREGHYQVVTLGELVDLLNSGEPLPERLAALSVDDVYRSFLTGALPLLQQFGYRATLFLNTSTVGDDDYLTWPEIAELAKSGFEIGNHSAAHQYLLDRKGNETDEAWRHRVEQDLLSAQEAFAGHLGFTPELFAYPYGEYDPVLVELVRQLGFKAAFGQQSGVASADHDRYTLPRFPMAGPYTAAAQFEAKLKMLPMPVEVISPTTPRLDKIRNPPTLKVRIDLSGLDAASLRCYVNGEPASLQPVPAEGPGVYLATAAGPLQGRRNKYTLTASDPSGRRWFWFSQLWVLPGS